MCSMSVRQMRMILEGMDDATEIRVCVTTESAKVYAVQSAEFLVQAIDDVIVLHAAEEEAE